MIRFQSKFLVEAASNSVIKEAQQRFGKNPKFPQDEAGLKAMFEALDTVVPKEAQAVSAGKKIYLWLVKQLMNSQAADPLEDLPAWRPLLVSFWKGTRPGGSLKGEQANIDHYRDISDLREAVTKKEEKVEEEGGSVHNETELEEIKKGAKMIYHEGEFTLWKVPATNDTWIKNNTGGDNASKLGVFRAAYLLCSNARNNTHWCVGYDTGGRTSLAASYIPQGDFFVLQRNGRAIYAIDSNSNSLRIWNAADNTIYSVGGYGGYGSGSRGLASIEEGAKKAGVTVNLDGLSAIPEELIKPLAAVKNQEPALKIIPDAHLGQMDESAKANLHKALLFTDPVAFVKDLSQMYSSHAQYATAHALMHAALSESVHMDITAQAFQQMNRYCVVGYLEALAPTMHRDKRRVPEAFDEAVIPLIQAWGKAAR